MVLGQAEEEEGVGSDSSICTACSCLAVVGRAVDVSHTRVSHVVIRHETAEWPSV